MPHTVHLPFIFRHAWALFIAVTCLNGAMWWRRGGPWMARNPALREQYRRLIRGWLIWGNLPWLVMGVGILSGAVPSTVHYFNPRNGAFVILFYGTVIAIWILKFNWVFFAGGAEKLIACPGLFNPPMTRTWTVKALVLASLAGGVVGLSVMCFGNIQIPVS